MFAWLAIWLVVWLFLHLFGLFVCLFHLCVCVCVCVFEFTYANLCHCKAFVCLCLRVHVVASACVFVVVRVVLCMCFVLRIAAKTTIPLTTEHATNKSWRTLENANFLAMHYLEQFVTYTKHCAKLRVVGYDRRFLRTLSLQNSMGYFVLNQPRKRNLVCAKDKWSEARPKW